MAAAKLKRFLREATPNRPNCIVSTMQGRQKYSKRVIRPAGYRLYL
jgi:hypothetical protein